MLGVSEEVSQTLQSPGNIIALKGGKAERKYGDIREFSGKAREDKKAPKKTKEDKADTLPKVFSGYSCAAVQKALDKEGKGGIIISGVSESPPNRGELGEPNPRRK